MSQSKSSRRAAAALPAGACHLSDAELAAFGPKLATDEGMAEFLTCCFGTKGWVYDRDADRWVAPDLTYGGPGRRFWVIRRGGDWKRATLRPDVLQ